MEVVKTLLNGGTFIQKEDVTSSEFVPDEVIDQDLTSIRHYFSEDAWLRITTTSKVWNCGHTFITNVQCTYYINH